jgi:hypothetical protein
LWEFVPLLNGNDAFDLLATDFKQTLAMQFIAAGIDYNFINSQFVGTFSDNFYKFISGHCETIFLMCWILPCSNLNSKPLLLAAPVA